MKTERVKKLLKEAKHLGMNTEVLKDLSIGDIESVIKRLEKRREHERLDNIIAMALIAPQQKEETA